MVFIILTKIQILIVLSHFDASNGYVVENRLLMTTSRSAPINAQMLAAGGAGGPAGMYDWSLEHEITGKS